MIAAIELGILARLRAAGDTGLLGYRWKTLETYPDDWEVFLASDNNWRSPMGFATFAGTGALTRRDGGQLMLRASFGVVVAAQNKRNQTSARHGHGDAEPGAYQLVEDVAGLLDGSDLDLDIQPLELTAISPVALDRELQRRGASMYALRFDCDMPISGHAGDGDIAPFASFHVNWDIPPHGGVDAEPDTPGVQLPADAQADATDHVELPQ